MKLKQQPCAYCDASTSGTVDHIPPKSLFPKPRPSDLITVPSCPECNHSCSQDDEEFKAFISLHQEGVTVDNPGLTSNALRTLSHNRRLRDEIVSGGKRGWLKTSAGVLVNPIVSVPWSGDSHDKVVERIARGLFWHHSGFRVPDTAKVKPYFFNEVPPNMKQTGLPWQVLSVADGGFRYEVSNDPAFEASIWLFQFFQKHWAGAFITNVEDPQSSK